MKALRMRWNKENTSQSNHIEAELDPLAYALGRASGHIAFTISNHRI